METDSQNGRTEDVSSNPTVLLEKSILCLKIDCTCLSTDAVKQVWRKIQVHKLVALIHNPGSSHLDCVSPYTSFVLLLFPARFATEQGVVKASLFVTWKVA